MSDPTSQSNFETIVTVHVAFDWSVDFEKKVIAGSATHTLFVIDDSVREVVFDTLDLDVSDALVNGKPAEFSLGPRHEVMGSALRVNFADWLPKGFKVEVTVQYSTGSGAAALQFLEKEQTQGNQFPYLFSQCQPIYARSMAPLQDTPSVKLTYSSKVRSVLPVLMSAMRVSPPSEGPPHEGKEIGKDIVTYSYNQPTPIPSYLIAIASGDVRYKAFERPAGKEWKSGIWAEPSLIDGAFWEFKEDTTRFLAKEEEIVTPYRFGVYDLLVLPPSFPYGGMENACLSFLTPSLLAGDRTLVDVVVHELTHSWFGNGVTHQNATHFWLNEGWTTYIERLLQQFLHSPAHRSFSYLIGYKSLQDAFKEYRDSPKYRRLVIEFEKGEDPDVAYSIIPYEKGSTFLLYLERRLGGLDVFLPYIRDYVNTFMGKSINTQMWKDHLFSYWSKNGGDEKVEILNSVNWDAWLYGESDKLPEEVTHDTSLAEQAYALAKRWDESRSKDVKSLDFKPEDLSSFDSNQQTVFLDQLQTYPALPPTHLDRLGDVYGFSKTSNSELRYRFYTLALSDPNMPESKGIAVKAAKWIVGEDGSGKIQGRMKFCRPVLRAANRANASEVVKLYTTHKMAFHPIARKLLSKDLDVSD